MDVREVLHWLVSQHDTPAYARHGQPSAAEVRKAIDVAYGAAEPDPPAEQPLSDEEQAQLAALQARQQAVTATQPDPAE